MLFILTIFGNKLIEGILCHSIKYEIINYMQFSEVISEN